MVIASCFSRFVLVVAATIATTRGHRLGGGNVAVTNGHGIDDLNVVWIEGKNDTDNIPLKQIGIDVHGLPVMMPLVGAGTWQYNETTVYESLCKAFGVGYTMVDTAYNYRNQKGVGKAIRDCYSGKRQELFLLTKVPGGLTKQQTLAAHHQNMWELQLDYVDHLLLHFPADWEEKHASKKIRQESWMALEEIYYSGKARSIGVSHYCTKHLDDILEVATVPISINQVEYHIGSGDVDNVIPYCQKHDITFMSFSPLCGPCQLGSESESLITGDLVTSIAKGYKNVTGAQVALRYIVQQALDPKNSIGGVIPKSNDVKHLKDNMNLFSFRLTQADMKRLKEANKPEAEAGDCDVP